MTYQLWRTTLALMVDQNGFPVGSKIFKGNQTEPATLNNILSEYLPDGNTDLFSVKPTLIMDRGIATKENIKRIQSRNLDYAVVERHQNLLLNY